MVPLTSTQQLPVTTTVDAAGLARVLTDTILSGSPALTATWGYNQNTLPLTESVGIVGTTTPLLTQTLGYDGDSRLTSISSQSALTNTAPLSRTDQYSYLPVGWTSAQTTTTGPLPGNPTITTTTQTYTHDPLGRLVSTAGGGPNSTTASWSYDGDGNLQQVISGTGSSAITSTYGYTATSSYSPTNWLPANSWP